MKINKNNIFRGGLMIVLAGTMVGCSDGFLEQAVRMVSWSRIRCHSTSQLPPIAQRQVCRLPSHNVTNS